MSEDEINNLVDARITARIAELKDAVLPDTDLKKFMYDKNYEELKLSRDWAIKVSAFTSAVYFGIITLANSEVGKETITGKNRIIIIIALCLFTFLGGLNICLRHLSYLEYRNVQIRLQNDLGIHHLKDGNDFIFPQSWRNPIIFIKRFFAGKNGLFKNMSGYLFYLLYLVITFIVTIIVVSNISTKTNEEIQNLKRGKNLETTIKQQDSIIRSSIIHLLDSNNRIMIGMDTVNFRAVK